MFQDGNIPFLFFELLSGENFYWIEIFSLPVR